MKPDKGEKVIEELKKLLKVTKPDISQKELFAMLNKKIEDDELEILLAFSRKINEILGDSKKES